MISSFLNKTLYWLQPESLIFTDKTWRIMLLILNINKLCQTTDITDKLLYKLPIYAMLLKSSMKTLSSLLTILYDKLIWIDILFLWNLLSFEVAILLKMVHNVLNQIEIIIIFFYLLSWFSAEILAETCMIL